MYNIMNSEPEYSDYSEHKQFLKLFCNVALLCYITLVLSCNDIFVNV